MPYFDTTYTNGVIAAREKYLLKDKIFRLCEMDAQDAFRALLESGFGGGAEGATGVHDYENLITAEENSLDAFIREYAPSKAESIFLLSPRDFHNAKAFVKASYLGVDPTRMLAPQGLVEIAKHSACIENKNFAELKKTNAALCRAIEDAISSLEEAPSGAKVGEIFEKALYGYLAETVKFKPIFKKLLTQKADMTNILTALRCGEKEIAKEKYLPAGKLSKEKLDELFLEDKEKAVRAFADTPYLDFVKLCFEDKEKGLPMTAAEKLLGSLETEYFAARKYDLVKNEPFLYYVYRRRTENANVRIVFACLLAGQTEYEIKKRLRAF